MKIEFDTSNPQDVAAVQRLLGTTASAPAAGNATSPAPTSGAPVPPTTTAPPPAATSAPAPTPTPAPAASPAPAAPAAPASPPPSAAPAPAPAAPAPAAGGATRDALSAHVQAYAKAKGPNPAKARLKELGYGKVSEVQDTHIAWVIENMPLA